MNGAEDEERRRRGERLDEDLDALLLAGDGVGARFRVLPFQQLARGSGDRGIELCVAERAQRFFREQQELCAQRFTAHHRRHGDRRAGRDRLLQAGLDFAAGERGVGHSVTGSTKTSMVPPQARPTSQAISSVMP